MTYSLYIALLLVVGLFGGKLASKIGLPSVTGYILFGLFLGPSAFNIITPEVNHNLAFVNELALAILALTVGTELHRNVIRLLGRNLAIISIGNSSLSFALVTGLTYWLGMPLTHAMMLGAVSMTISPSGVVHMLKETRAKGELSQTIMGLVAFDNLFTIIVFGIVMAFVQSSSSQANQGFMLVVAVFLNIIYAAIIGVISGLFISFFIRRNVKKDPLLVIVLAAILFNSGIATMFGLSPILVNIVCGMTLTNLTNRKALVSGAINQIELPIFVIFLTLAGAHLDISIFSSVGLIGLGYIIGRGLGKFIGAYIASQFTSLPSRVKNNIGLSIISQAGVAIGLATIAEQSIPGVTGILTGVVLTGVIVFEITGPLLFARALKNVDEVNKL